LQQWTRWRAKSIAAFWRVRRDQRVIDYVNGSLRLNASFANHHAYFDIPWQSVAKLLAIAEIDDIPSVDMRRADIGQLGDLANSLSDARDDIRLHWPVRDSVKKRRRTPAPRFRRRSALVQHRNRSWVEPASALFFVYLPCSTNA